MQTRLGLPEEEARRMLDSMDEGAVRQLLRGDLSVLSPVTPLVSPECKAKPSSKWSLMPPANLELTESERTRREEVLRALVEAIEGGVVVRLPSFDPAVSRPSPSGALVSVGIEPNPYGGTAGPYRYQFEGEEDLLHLIVTRQDQAPLTTEEGQSVVAALLPEVPPALIWLRPGELSQHFFLGHDDLVASLQTSLDTSNPDVL